MNPRLNIDAPNFLAEYWQQKPLFISQGISSFEPPADADELAGLALEADVDSRIISCTDGVWQQELGPFTAQALQRSGAWSLLVQSVDQYWDEAATLLRAVQSLPSWRLDNLMMSYANDGGTAGPHFDNYDVFIIQGDGQRRWQLGARCDDATPLLAHADLSLLADFEVCEEYLMSCGDVLYIPPGVAHYGVSVGESTSFSIGFRAPRLNDLLARWTDLRLENLHDKQLLCDAGRQPAQRCGEIDNADIQRGKAQLLELFSSDDPRWFGEAITDTHGADDAEHEDPEFLLQNDLRLTKSPGSRMAWSAHGQEIIVFAQGSSLRVSETLAPLIETLCQEQSVIPSESLALHPQAKELLTWLIEAGAVLSND